MNSNAEQSKKDLDYSFLDAAMVKILPFLNKEDVTDISCRESHEIIVKHFAKGKERTGIFLMEEEIQNIIRLAANAFENDIAYSSGFSKLETVIPKYDARFTGLLQPSVKKAQFTIRRPPSTIYPLEDYLEKGRLTFEQYELITAYIKSRKNILVGGATGSGKTTFLNAVIKKMVEYTPDDCFYVVEDVPELRCEAVEKTMVCIKPSVAAEAVATVLRWTSDRVIFGELRYGDVCLEFLNVLNTGHTGSASTIHANNARMMMSRMRELLRMAVKNEIPSISSVIHLFIHLSPSSVGPKVDEVLATENLETVFHAGMNGISTDDFFNTYEKNFSPV